MTRERFRAKSRIARDDVQEVIAMRLVTYSFRGVTRLGATNGEAEIIDLARAGSLRGVLL